MFVNGEGCKDLLQLFIHGFLRGGGRGFLLLLLLLFFLVVVVVGGGGSVKATMRTQKVCCNTHETHNTNKFGCSDEEEERCHHYFYL